MIFLRTGKGISEILELDLETQQLTALYRDEVHLEVVGENDLGDVLFRTFHEDDEGKIKAKLFALTRRSQTVEDITKLCD